MKNTLRLIGIIAVIAIIGFVVTACDNGNQNCAHTPGAVATCTTAQTCTTCGHVITDALGHTFSLWEKTTDPTYITEGEETEKCSVCDTLGTNKKAIPRIAITSIAQFSTVIDELADNTALTPYTLRVNIDDLGGNILNSDSIGGIVHNYEGTKFIILDMSGSTFTNIEALAFGSEGGSCENLVGITLPDSVTIIGGNAFEFSGLTSIIIPANVTAIKSYAFYACSSLTIVTVLATTPPDLEGRAFDRTHGDLIIFVPESSINTYKEHICGECGNCSIGECGWSEYADRIVAIP
jgi:hypothetical protein